MAGCVRGRKRVLRQQRRGKRYGTRNENKTQGRERKRKEPQGERIRAEGDKLEYNEKDETIRREREAYQGAKGGVGERRERENGPKLMDRYTREGRL